MEEALMRLGAMDLRLRMYLALVAGAAVGGLMAVGSRLPISVLAVGTLIVGTLLLAARVVLLLAQADRTHREQADERDAHVREREELFLPALEALGAAIEARDPAAHGHNQRVRTYALGCARALGITDDATLVALKYG